jgi:hypothetical protein
MALKHCLSRLAVVVFTAAVCGAAAVPLANAADAPAVPETTPAAATDNLDAPEDPAASADEGIPAGADTAAEDSDTAVEGEEPKK